MRRHGPVIAHCTDSEDYPISQQVVTRMHDSIWVFKNFLGWPWYPRTFTVAEWPPPAPNTQPGLWARGASTPVLGPKPWSPSTFQPWLRPWTRLTRKHFQHSGVMKWCYKVGQRSVLENCECIATWGRLMPCNFFSALIMMPCQVWSCWTYPSPCYSVLLLIHYFMLWPWPLNSDLEHLQNIICL